MLTIFMKHFQCKTNKLHTHRTIHKQTKFLKFIEAKARKTMHGEEKKKKKGCAVEAAEIFEWKAKEILWEL